MLSENSFTDKINQMAITTEADNWEEQKVSLRKKFPRLTDNDLMFADGKKDEMMDKLQKKLGKTKDQIQQIISDFKR